MFSLAHPEFHAPIDSFVFFAAVYQGSRTDAWVKSLILTPFFGFFSYGQSTATYAYLAKVKNEIVPCKLSQSAHILEMKK